MIFDTLIFIHQTNVDRWIETFWLFAIPDDFWSAMLMWHDYYVCFSPTRQSCGEVLEDHSCSLQSLRPYGQCFSQRALVDFLIYILAISFDDLGWDRDIIDLVSILGCVRGFFHSCIAFLIVICAQLLSITLIPFFCGVILGDNTTCGFYPKWAKVSLLCVLSDIMIGIALVLLCHSYSMAYIWVLEFVICHQWLQFLDCCMLSARLLSFSTWVS